MLMSKAKVMTKARCIFLNSSTFVSLYKPQFFTQLEDNHIEIPIEKIKESLRKMRIPTNPHSLVCNWLYTD